MCDDQSYLFFIFIRKQWNYNLKWIWTPSLPLYLCNTQQAVTDVLAIQCFIIGLLLTQQNCLISNRCVLEKSWRTLNSFSPWPNNSPKHAKCTARITSTVIHLGLYLKQRAVTVAYFFNQCLIDGNQTHKVLLVPFFTS